MAGGGSRYGSRANQYYKLIRKVQIEVVSQLAGLILFLIQLQQYMKKNKESRVVEHWLSNSAVDRSLRDLEKERVNR